MISIWQIIILVAVFLLFILPAIFALRSEKVRGWKKFFWFVLALNFSWIGYFLYSAVAIKKEANSAS